MFAEGPSLIKDTDCVNTSYPGFYQMVEGFMNPADSSRIPVISSLPVE
jgi:5-enolpyruvylshikimate-3-phosphate synthase